MTWRGKATLLAILGVLQQALLLAWIVPAGAMPLPVDTRFDAAICGWHDAGPIPQSHDGPATPCQLCPLCVALANPVPSPEPVAMAGPLRFFISLPRMAPRPDHSPAALAREAPRQRGPPAALRPA